jgi:hypothetical protein
MMSLLLLLLPLLLALHEVLEATTVIALLVATPPSVGECVVVKRIEVKIAHYNIIGLVE